MTIHTGSSDLQPWVNPVLFSRYPVDLIEEIKEYKRQTERLGRVYDLHRRLGKTLDLNAMVEAFSLWLAPYLDHSLMAYRHFNQEHLSTICSCHGEHRGELLNIAQTLLKEPIPVEDHGWVEACGLFYHLWPLSQEKDDCLLVLHAQSRAQMEPSFLMLEGVLQDLHGPLQRTLAYEELYNQARRDALTGLVNRRVFEERIIQELAHAERYHWPLVLACLDLDHFKAINDRLGHAEGDAVLKQVSQTFSALVRDTDLLARIGGDEFAMVLPNTSLESAQQLMSRLCRAVTDLGIHAPHSPALGVSIGLASWQSGVSFERLWEQADSALYQAKAAGRSRVACY